MSIHRCLEMGGVAISLGGPENEWGYPTGQGHRYFATTRSPDVVVEVGCLEGNQPAGKSTLVAEGPEAGSWRIYATDGGFGIADRVFVPHLSIFFERRSLFDACFQQGHVLLPSAAFKADGLFPLRYALDFLLVANHLLG